jgi:hypothetical protein
MGLGRPIPLIVIQPANKTSPSTRRDNGRGAALTVLWIKHMIHCC